MVQGAASGAPQNCRSCVWRRICVAGKDTRRGVALATLRRRTQFSSDAETSQTAASILRGAARLSTVAIDRFSPAVAAWFESNFAAPTPPQLGGWPAIANGDHTLIIAPTGSGKTLAAFLWAIDQLGNQPVIDKQQRCRVLYISPLRALAVDVDKNLRAPLRGIEFAAERLGVRFTSPTVGIRTGDTDSKTRAGLLRNPPDILITTPESLYLMLTSKARETLRSVEYVIIDEIHAMAPTKRGAHLAIALERLGEITTRLPQRIGLSATVRPVQEIATFLGGFDGGVPRPVTIIDAGARKELDIEIIVPIDDMANVNSAVDENPSGPSGPEARNSIWPHVHPLLLELIRAHTTTLIFTNARRLAERLAARLNDLAGEELVRAHHGSLARDQRLQVENDLKSGQLRAIVATSSLELGIDMGTVDLVVLVESPGSVARGLQRIGRSGHQIDAPSKGKLFPKWRGDLLETAAVVRRMREGIVEEMRIIQNPLDVVAQHVVAACSMDEWNVEALRATIRRSANCAQLSDDVFDGVLDLLSGRYPSDQFAGLRPRIIWDRVAGTATAREGSQRIAVTNGGTIPDRGLFGVFLPGGGRVGELDEEMVYESRVGEVFALGASSWRIEEITHDRVIVTPAPGEQSKMPFWRGDKPGRPLELGRGMGAITRELRAVSTEIAQQRLRADGFDERAASNLTQYLADQHEATGAVPDDQTIVIERFPDEIGDWSVCILTPFGARVHAPWAMAIEAQLEAEGIDAPPMWSDDGIVFRLPEALNTLPLETLIPSSDTVEQTVVDRLPSTSLFASRFRENAARALLLPRRDPGRRTPLWMQRQRSADLLEVASQYPAFPILLETTRECLRDVFDLPALREVLNDISMRRVKVVQVETRRASPFAQSLLFGWIAVYMYEGDTPIAERRAAALSLDRGLLRDLLGNEDFRELLDGAALAQLELELQRLTTNRFIRSADGLTDLLRDLGDLRVDEIQHRCSTPEVVAGWIRDLLLARRIIELQIAGQSRFAAAEDAARFRDGLGCALPSGLPAAFTEPVDRPLDELVARYARTHGPFTTEQCAQRFDAPNERVDAALQRLSALGRVVAGEFRPQGNSREWCDDGVLRQLRRRSLAALRKEVEPVDPTVYARFLPAWQGITNPRRGLDALVETIEQLQGVAMPASVLESSILPARVRDYQPAMLDSLCSSGELVWVGAGPLGDDGRVRLFFRDRIRLLAPACSQQSFEPAELHQMLLEHFNSAGASFWSDLVAATGNPAETALLHALWDLVWAGLITNDTFAPVRAPRTNKRPSARTARSRPNVSRLSRLGPPAAAGRWSLVAPLLLPTPSPTEVAHATALTLLERHGIATREAVNAEGIVGGFAGVYPILKALEEAGKVRRGWFVAELGAAQFAMSGPIERLRNERDSLERTEPVVLSAVDPAQPYGSVLSWPEHAHGRGSRTAGATVVLRRGSVVAFLERGGKTMLTFEAFEDLHALASAATNPNEEWIGALVDAVQSRKINDLQLQTINGEPARTAPIADDLRNAGFADGFKGLVLRSR